MSEKNTENITTKFRVDISDLKKGIADANKTIKLANAQFKNATAGMDNWADSADGLTAKIEQQESIVEAEKKKLSALKEELKRLNDSCKKGQGIISDLTEKYEEAASTYGLTSDEAKKYAKMLSDAQTAQERNEKAAENLNVKIINQDTAVKNAKGQLKKYSDQLADLKSSTEYLKDEQDKLNSAYDDAVSKYGKNSDEAKNLKTELKKVTDELKEAKDSSKKLSDEFDKTDDSARKTKDGFTVMKGALADLVSEGIKKAISAFGDLLTASEKASSSLQAQTGLSSEEMQEFKSEMDDLYKNNYGESLEDIGNAMAIIKQNTKETDPSKIKDLTKNALVLRDTFGFDIQETMRAANMLINQFGITGEEAFNLIAQGAQNGLNKNDDLLDTINEYSVHYQQQGYSAEQFFNSLYNGAESGTFSIDKLGDAMKEFGIRTKDTSDTTTEGFSLLGLNADKMRKKFAAGGESAQQATEETLEALFSLDNQVKQNQAGVDLFGTMWEDLGADGIKALTNVSGEADKTADTMKEINEVKYSDSQNSLEEISRTLRTDILQPLANKLMPEVKKGLDWVKKKTPEIKRVVTKYIIAPFEDKVYPILKKSLNFAKDNLPEIISLIAGIGSAVATWKVASIIATVVTKITALSGALKTGTSLMGAFNSVMKMNPAVAVASAIGGVIGAIWTYKESTKDATEKQKLFTDEQQKTIDKCNEVAQAYKDSKEEREKTFSDTDAEFGYYEELFKELDTIVDKNGKIKKGYEDRAEYITTTLGDALGTEIDITDGVVEKYDELKDKIAEVIEIKKAEAMLSALEGDYTDAITNRTDAWEAYNDARQNVADTEAEIAKKEKDIARAQEIYEENYNNPNQTSKTQKTSIQALELKSKYKKELATLKSQLKEQKKAMNSAEDAYVGYTSVVKNYSNLSEAVISEDVDKINESLLDLENNFVSSDEATTRILENQLKTAKNHLKDLKKSYEDGSPYVTKVMVDEAETMVEKCENELSKGKIKAYNQMLATGEKAAAGLKAKKSDVSYAGTLIANAAVASMLKTETYKAGEKNVEKFINGMNSKNGNAKQSVNDLMNTLKEIMENVDTAPIGAAFVLGFTGGVNGALNSAVTAVADFGFKALESLRTSLDTHSPSRETEKIGRYFDEGFINEVANGESSMVKKIKSMFGNILEAAQNSLQFDKLSFAVSSTNNSLKEATRVPQLMTSNSQVSNVYNFTQNNNSPKSLNRYEIYRQTKNLINAVKRRS